jgi:hypothetical protein
MIREDTDRVWEFAGFQKLLGTPAIGINPWGHWEVGPECARMSRWVATRPDKTQLFSGIHAPQPRENYETYQAAPYNESNCIGTEKNGARRSATGEKPGSEGLLPVGICQKVARFSDSERATKRTEESSRVSVTIALWNALLAVSAWCKIGD